MKNHKIFLSLFLVFLTGIISFVHAQTPTPTPALVPSPTPTLVPSPALTLEPNPALILEPGPQNVPLSPEAIIIPLMPEICNILRWLKNIMIVLAVLFIIFYGYQMMSAGGDASKTEGAKKGILWVLIATAIILTVTSIIKMVNKDIPVCSNL